MALWERKWPSLNWTTAHTQLLFVTYLNAGSSIERTRLELRFSIYFVQTWSKHTDPPLSALTSHFCTFLLQSRSGTFSVYSQVPGRRPEWWIIFKLCYFIFQNFNEKYLNNWLIVQRKFLKKISKSYPWNVFKSKMITFHNMKCFWNIWRHESLRLVSENKETRVGKIFIFSKGPLSFKIFKSMNLIYPKSSCKQNK